ncbi:hypothetical protein GURASL_18470 [Geotalea uraniireducens]|uniref:histidine kinase n=1 Tax=Geotalea uraniireducens TaxID=351604 RepID=A0ABM8EKF8_9BACT|nr:CHASE2 domain-containing protein [Geotalea uraniireducens]BDV42924.1 hypothetical protein GURASL_18470 [Geotalea uraniireducens]
MMARQERNRWRRDLLVVAAGLLAIGLIAHLGAFDGVNSYCYDLAFRVRGTVRPPRQLLIAAIDEPTLHELGRWPLPRRYYATLLDRLAEARAVGFTIIMTEPSADDPLLAAAARRQGRTVLPLYIDDRLRTENPAPALAGLPVGHLHLEQDLDGVVRREFLYLRHDSRTVPALAAAVAAWAGAAVPTVPPPEGGKGQLIAQGRPLNLNYYGPPGTIPTVSLADLVAGRLAPARLRGKVVLVGITAPGIEERFITPFGQQRNRMAAVEVQATAVGNLLDGSAIRPVVEGTRLVLCLLFAAGLYLLLLQLSETGAVLTWLATVGGVTVTVYLLFTQGHRWLAPGIFYVAATYLCCAALLFRLKDAAARLQQYYAAVASHLEAEGEAAVPQDGGLRQYLSPGGINARIALLEKVNRQLLDRSVQAEAANRELEAFSYSVSHDLQAPLRRIGSFVDALGEDAADRLNETERDYLNRIGIATGRMRNLIDALLDLGRLSRLPIRRETIDLADMAREIAAELQKAEPERAATFIIPDRLVVSADARLMRNVMENLLNNAWKYSRQRQPARIEFGVDAAGQEPAYFVRDNGAGFDMRYADKLFTPFQRLHDEGAFEGNGIGLATVRRIISRHGGTVWGEGIVGEGATFHFTLGR